MLGLEQLSPEDRKTVGRARRLERFLTQPFFATEQFSGIKGKLVSLKDALDGCERILNDEFKDYPESALYMIGVIGEARKGAAPDKPGQRGARRQGRMNLHILLPFKIFAQPRERLSNRCRDLGRLLRPAAASARLRSGAGPGNSQLLNAR